MGHRVLTHLPPTQAAWGPQSEADEHWGPLPLPPEWR